ncbi:MAG: iron-containing alcohol dehydrogenase [Candidatus Omnitrophica bacterium]|nr:iron-containing alcohol dehydrogenase [Candidatus Omnitrophota bacterium]
MTRLGQNFTCPLCQSTHQLPVKRIVHSPGALNKTEEFVTQLFSSRQKAAVLSDEITHQVAGRTVEEKISALRPVTSVILTPENEERLSTREEYLNYLLTRITGCSLLVTVGSGTITDLGKYAGEVARIPVLCIATAASMNGYTSGVAAIFQNQVKLAIPVKPALGVLIDSDIINSAPLILTQAGFADSLARRLANADWYLGSLLTGEKYCPLPGLLVEQIERKHFLSGRLIRNGEPAGANLVMEALILGGLAMVIAGSSAPASGGEHLISHFWDMYAHQEKRVLFAYHGLQVGLGCLITARIYDRLKELTLAEILLRLKTHQVPVEDELKELFSLFPFAQKYIKTQWEQKQKALALVRSRLVDCWEKLVQQVFPEVHASRQLKETLSQAGCPVYPSEISLPVGLARKALKLARYIRNRLTILDIAAELGILQEIEPEIESTP